MNNDCLYCKRNQTQKDLMIEVCDLQCSTVFLFKEQSHKGRCVVAYKDHVNELHELSDADAALFIQDAKKVGGAISRLFGAKKINYGAYSDKLPHLHLHIVPKYEDGFEWGGTFEMNPKKTYLTDPENEKLVATLRAELKK